MVLVHPTSPSRRSARAQRPTRPARRAVRVSPAPLSRAPASGLRDRGWVLLWRALDRVPAGWWRMTVLYLAGRYLVLLAATAVVLADPRGAGADLARWRGVGEVSVLLGGRPAVGAAVLGAALGWALLLLLRELLVRSGAVRLADRAPLLVAVSVVTAAVCTTPTTLLVPAGAAAVALLLRRRTPVR